MVDDGRRTDGRRTDGRTTEHGYTISSPCEPDGSGELIKVRFFGSSGNVQRDMAWVMYCAFSGNEP